MHIVQIDTQVASSRRPRALPVKSIRVALVSMPFFSAKAPSIQLGLLKAIANNAGFLTTTFHLNVDFSARIGSSLYESICDHRGHLGEWIFSTAAFGHKTGVDRMMVLDIFSKDESVLRMARSSTGIGTDSALAELLDRLQGQLAPEFLEDAIRSIRWEHFDVVGFTSTFQQNPDSIYRVMKHLFTASTILAL